MQTSIPRCIVGLTLSASIAIGAIGCGDSATGNLKTYAELDGQSFEEKTAATKSESGDETQGAVVAKTEPKSVGDESKPAEKTNPPANLQQVNPTKDKTDTVTVEPKANSQPTVVESGDPQKPVDVKTTVGETIPAEVKVASADTANSADATQQTDEAKAKNVKRDIKLLVAEKRFRRVDPDDSFRVSYDDIDLLKILNMDPVPTDAEKHFPEWLSGLNGKRIRIRGFMIPMFIPDGITRFQLARDTQLCCFGRDPLPYDIIPVNLRTGVTTHYIHLRAFDVVGVFHIQNTIDEFDGSLRYVYKIDDAIIIER